MTNLADMRDLNLDTHQGPFILKPMTAHFQSFGEALFNWMNAQGSGEQKQHTVDKGLARAYCVSNQIRYEEFALFNALKSYNYFDSVEWVYAFINRHGYFPTGGGIYFKLDEHNRPISYLHIYGDSSHNVNGEIAGAYNLVREFREVAKENVRVDDSSSRLPFLEVLLQNLANGQSYLTNTEGIISNKRQNANAFYPYIEGGVEALIRDFMESDESVLILMGPPGTGKSSIVSVAAESMNLLPIYAKRSEVILHPNFVGHICATSDRLMEKVHGSGPYERQALFKRQSIKDVEYPNDGMLTEDEAEGRIPLIIVEDADALIAPRSEGNLLMANLLNETDGVSSNHSRKLLFATNLTSTKAIDEALMRPGRCYDVVNCRLLTPDEAVAARSAAGLPDFDVVPRNDVSLAEALRKPRKKLTIAKSKARIGF